jgi:hypothetical protein
VKTRTVPSGMTDMEIDLRSDLMSEYSIAALP